MALENNWKEIGDDRWDLNNLMYELPMKWELSFIALYEEKVVGYQIGSLRDGNAFLNKIVVDNNIRGLGIGRNLLRAFLEKSLKKGIEKIIFRVRIDNPAVEFYDKLKFNRIPGVDKTRSDGIASYWYENIIKEVIKNV